MRIAFLIYNCFYVTHVTSEHIGKKPTQILAHAFFEYFISDGYIDGDLERRSFLASMDPDITDSLV